MRPDGYISFGVWVGDQQHAVWAHRLWTAWDLFVTVASHAGYDAQQAALIAASNGQGFSPTNQIENIAALTAGALRIIPRDRNGGRHPVPVSHRREDEELPCCRDPFAALALPPTP
eukprot:3385539-Alexandrium_andersonii.AAC.1